MPVTRGQFGVFLLAMEQAIHEELTEYARKAGIPLPVRPADPMARLAAFVPTLSLRIVGEAASRLGRRSIPDPDEPLAAESRGVALFLLSVVACLCDCLRGAGIYVDLKCACALTIEPFYDPHRRQNRVSESVAVINKLILDYMPTPQFRSYLARLEVVVRGYVTLPERREDAVVVAAGLLKQLLGALE